MNIILIFLLFISLLFFLFSSFPFLEKKILKSLGVAKQNETYIHILRGVERRRGFHSYIKSYNMSRMKINPCGRNSQYEIS